MWRERPAWCKLHTRGLNSPEGCGACRENLSGPVGGNSGTAGERWKASF